MRKQRPPSSDLLAGDPQSPVILHVPHAATSIPGWVREDIVLDDADLRAEVLTMADIHTDMIAALAVHQAQRLPWVFLNRLSRLVVDPERFPDEREEMRAVGMGAVYTRTSSGEALREPTPDQEAALITRYFDPYAAMMTAAVESRLAACGRAVIIDLHSFPRDALPYELHKTARRPELCIGVDALHTHPDWLDSTRQAFADFGEHAINEPFAGTYIPLEWYGSDQRVWGIMLEIRRDTYADSTGAANLDAINDLAQRVAAVVDRSGSKL